MSRRSNLIALYMVVFFAAAIAMPVVYAATATDYLKRIPITITNGNATTLDYPVCAQVNPPGLVAAGFLEADALDAAAFDVAESEISLTRQDPTSSTDCWWIDPPQPLLSTQTDTSYLHVDQATPGGDNPNRWAARESRNDQITDADGADWEDNTISIFAGSITIDSFPGVEGWVIYKDGSTAWEAGITSLGAPYLEITCSAGACAPGSPVTITGTALVAGTIYNIAWAADLAGSADDGIWVDGVLDVAWTGVGTMATNATNVIAFASISADVEQVRFYDGTVYNHSIPAACNAATFCWDFTPDDLLQTQGGSSANAWHWEGTIDNDGTAGGTADYLLVRDHSSVTVDVQALQSKTAIPLVAVSQDLGIFVPDLPDLSVQEATGTFTGLNTLERAVNQIGGQNDGFLLLAMVAIGAVLGGAVTLATKFSGLGVGLMAFPVTLGGPFGWYAWGWVALALILIFVVSGLLAAVGRR